MPGKPKHHREAWSEEELLRLKDSMASEMAGGRSAWQAAKALRYQYRRRPAAIASVYYRRIIKSSGTAKASEPTARLFAVPTVDVISADTPEEILRLLAENGVNTGDLNTITIIRGSKVSLKTKTTYEVEEA